MACLQIFMLWEDQVITDGENTGRSQSGDRAVCHGAVTTEQGGSKEETPRSLEVNIPTWLEPRLRIPGHSRGKTGMSKFDSLSDSPYPRGKGMSKGQDGHV